MASSDDFAVCTHCSPPSLTFDFQEAFLKEHQRKTQTDAIKSTWRQSEQQILTTSNQKNETWCWLLWLQVRAVLWQVSSWKKRKVDLPQTTSNYSLCYFSISSFKTFFLPLHLHCPFPVTKPNFLIGINKGVSYLIKNTVQCRTIYLLILYCCFDTITDCKVLHSVCSSSSPSSCLSRGTLM